MSDPYRTANALVVGIGIILIIALIVLDVYIINQNPIQMLYYIAIALLLVRGVPVSSLQYFAQSAVNFFNQVTENQAQSPVFVAIIIGMICIFLAIAVYRLGVKSNPFS